MRAPACLLAVLAPLALARSSGAQEASADPSADARPALGVPRPRLGWSPLQRIGETGRGGPGDIALPDLLTEPAPRVGALWLTANPGAAAFEADTAPSSEFRSGYQGLSGDYRRPLDPASAGLVEVEATGAQRLGARTAALGHAALGRRELSGGGTRALGLEPYSGSPLAPTDTTSPDVGQSIAVMEGAMGWRAGGWGFGFSTGVEIVDARAAHARIGRLVRSSAPALALGVSRALPVAASRVGLYARGTRRSERITTVPMNASEVVHQLEGMNEVEPSLLGSTPYFRRVTRQGTLGGLSLDGTTAGARWLLFVERGELAERQSSADQANPPEDRWTTTEQRFGAAVQRALGARLVVTGTADRRSLTGDATRADLTGRIYRREASLLRLAGDVRLHAAAWEVALDGWTARREDRVGDPLAELSSDVTSWMPGGAAEVAFRLSPSLRLSLAGGAATYAPVSSVPAGDSLGPVFRSLIGPELEWSATPTTILSSAAALRWTSPRGTAVWLRLAGGRTAPSGSPPPTELRPTGKRTAVAMTLGVQP